MAKKVFILEEHINDEYEIDFEMDGYTHLQAFHACRPLKINDYLKKLDVFCSIDVIEKV